jgi:hypothetical protein
MTSRPNESGAFTLPAFMPIIKSAKLLVTLSGALTIFCALLVVALQIASWKKTGVWNPYPLSSVIESIKDDGTDVYVTASIGPPAGETIRQALFERILGIPAIVLLTAAAALHFAFYLYLTRLEKGWRP